MTGTIFDLVDEDLPEGQKGYFEFANRAPKVKDDSFYNTISDYGKTILKGTVEGLSKAGKMFGPLQHESLSSQQELGNQTETLDELLPTDEGFGQTSIRRGLRELPSMAAFPGSPLMSTATRSIVAGFAGEGAKELGLPEWAQSAAELTAFIGPDITKKLIESGKDKELIKKAKEMGFTDEQITPLIQSEFKQKWLSKLAPRRGKTQEALQNTKNQLQESYSGLKKSPNASKEISEIENGKLINSLQDKLNEMPSQVRDKVQKDLSDLLGNKITGESLINFYADINHYLGDNAKQLSLLKDPIKKALSSISPALSKDFEFINDLYSKYYKISSKLKPNLTSDIIQAGETLGLLGALATGNYPVIAGMFTEKTARHVARLMLTSPYLQKLGQKSVKAMNENKFGLAKKTIEEYKDYFKKIEPDVYEKLSELSDEELMEFFSNHQKS